MTRTVFIVTAAFAMLLAMHAQGEDIIAGSLKISAPWTRATPKSASVGGGYMTITNSGSASDRLLGGASNISERFEIHEMSVDHGVMKMRQISGGIEIKPGQTIEFKPGGYHVMFFGLKKPFERGQHIRATLDFEKAGKVAVDFNVEGVGASHDGGAAIPGGTQMQHGH